MKKLIVLMMLAFPVAGQEHKLFNWANTRRIATILGATISATDYYQTEYGLAHGGHEINAPGLIANRPLFFTVKMVPAAVAIIGELGPHIFHIRGQQRDNWDAIFTAIGGAWGIATLPAVIHNTGELGKLK